jgi:hypothetical protein
MAALMKFEETNGAGMSNDRESLLLVFSISTLIKNYGFGIADNQGEAHPSDACIYIVTCKTLPKN